MRLRLEGELLGLQGLELATGVRAHDFLEGQRYCGTRQDPRMKVLCRQLGAVSDCSSTA